MNEAGWERRGASSGYLAVALGIAGAAFERGAPAAHAPAAEIIAFVAQHQGELLAQSLFFVLSAGAYLWFFGSLRSALLLAEGGTGRLSMVAFGVGILWAGLQMVLQSAQIAGVVASGRGADAALAVVFTDLAYALSVVAYLPMSVMLAAVAVLTLRAAAFPAWLGWLSAGIAAANLLMALGIAVPLDLLVPGGTLIYVLYALTPVWLLSVTTLMVRRSGGENQTRSYRIE